jgi:hypothetical protein
MLLLTTIEGEGHPRVNARRIVRKREYSALDREPSLSISSSFCSGKTIPLELKPQAFFSFLDGAKSGKKGMVDRRVLIHKKVGLKNGVELKEVADKSP